MASFQDITDFQCQVLNRDLWSKPEVRNMIDQHFVFWQIYRYKILLLIEILKMIMIFLIKRRFYITTSIQICLNSFLACKIYHLA